MAPDQVLKQAPLLGNENEDHVCRIGVDTPMEAPVWVEKRVAKLGRSTDEWQRKRI